MARACRADGFAGEGALRRGRAIRLSDRYTRVLQEQSTSFSMPNMQETSMKISDDRWCELRGRMREAGVVALAIAVTFAGTAVRRPRPRRSRRALAGRARAEARSCAQAARSGGARSRGSEHVAVRQLHAATSWRSAGSRHPARHAGDQPRFAQRGTRGWRRGRERQSRRRGSRSRSEGGRRAARN